MGHLTLYYIQSTLPSVLSYRGNIGTIWGKAEEVAWWMEPLGSCPRVLNELPREKIDGPPSDFLKANPSPHPRPDQRAKTRGAAAAPRVFGRWFPALYWKCLIWTYLQNFCWPLYPLKGCVHPRLVTLPVEMRLVMLLVSCCFSCSFSSRRCFRASLPSAGSDTGAKLGKQV